MRRVRAPALCALACVLAAASLVGQQRADPPPTFRASVEVVEVDVYVTDVGGNPVSGLTADDFEVFENGQPRPITVFVPVSIPVIAREPAWADAESDVATNSGPDGRTFMIILDGSVEPGTALRSRHLLRQFIEENFGENDLAAVVTDQGLVTDGQDFTNNRRLLMTAIDKFAGAGAPDRYFRDLRDRIDLLARMPGHRKAILWVTSAIRFDPYDIIDYQGGLLALGGEGAHAAMSAATRGNIRIYPISPGGAGDVGLETAMDFRGVAEITGGFAHVNSNDFAGTWERLVRETGTYYILGFESPLRPKQGRYVRFDVKAKRPDLVVKARPGYVEQLEYIRKTTKPEPERTPVAAALANPVAVRGVPMRVNATAYRRAGGSHAAVAVTVDLDASALSFQERAGQFTTNLEIRHLATDERNTIYPEFRHSTALSISPEDHRRLTGDGLRVVFQVDLPKGRHQIRVASASGDRAGSVVYDLEIPDFRDKPLVMSGVALTSTSAAGGVTLQADARGGKSARCRPPRCPTEVRSGLTLTRWTPRASGASLPWSGTLPAPPATIRKFSPAETLTAFVEVYDNNRRLDKEPAYAIDATATLRAGGEPIRTVTERRVSRDPRRPSGGHGFTLSLPLEGVPPGTYMLEIEARAARLSVDPIRRRIPIRVTE